MPMQAVFYRDPDGNERARARCAERPTRSQAAVIENQLDRLNMQQPDEPPLPQPWTSQIEGELREFRAHYGQEHYRVLYRRSGNLLILLHLIRKTTGRRAQARHRDCEGALGRLQATDGRRQAHTAAGRRARRAHEPLAPY